MPTIPRTDPFSALVGSLPSDGASWVLGDHIAVDKPDDEYGSLNRYGKRDTGIIWASSTLSAEAWLAWREPAAGATIQVVRGKFFWRHVSGSRRDVQLGLMARLQSIASTAAGPPERWYKGDAYTLEAEIDATAETADIYIRRVDQGVESDLVAEAAVSWPEGETHDLYLKLKTRADGSVKLTAKMDGDDLMEIVDGAGTAHTGAGCYGLLTSSGKIATGESRGSIREFWAESGGGTIWLHDTFDRPNRQGSDDYYLRSLWWPTEAVATSGGEVSYSSEADVERVSLYQARPTDEDYTAQADVTFPNASDAHWCGVCARAGKASSSGDLDSFTGYLARLRIDDSTDNLEIKKVIDGTVIQTVTASVSGLSHSTPIVLKIDVSGTDTVTVKAYVDASLEATLTDQAADRLTQSGQGGIYLRRVSGGSGALVVDDFELGDPAASADTFTALPVADEDVGGISRYVVLGEDLSSQADGVKTTFDLADTPEAAANVALRHNGFRLKRVAGAPSALEFSVNPAGPTVTMGDTPAAGESLSVDYTLVGNTDVVIGEEPTGTRDGSNTLFLLANVPTAKGEGRCTLNGMELVYVTGASPGVNEYAQPGSQQVVVNAALAPTASDPLYFDYLKSGASPRQPLFGQTPTGAIDGSNRVFELPVAPNSPAECIPVLNGYPLQPASGVPSETEFSVVGKKITLGDTPDVGNWLRVHSISAGIFEAVLTDMPDYVLRGSQRFRGVSYKFEGGYVQSWPLSTNKRRVYVCVFGARTWSECNALMDFFESRTGPYQQFTWTAPRDTSPSTWHAKGPARYSKTDTDTYVVMVEFEQLITFAAAAA